MLENGLELYRKAKAEWVNSQSYSLILKEVGVPLRQPSGYQILIKRFETPDKIGSIILPAGHKDAELWNNRIGLVLAMGPDAYQNVDIPYCEIGEWVFYKKHESDFFEVNNVPLAYLADDKVKAPLDDPMAYGVKGKVNR